MIVFVDIEHESGRSDDHGEKLLAARTWITYRLEDLAEQPCMLVRYDHVSHELLEQLDARAIFLSGNSANPDVYDHAALAPLYSILRSGRWPVFGFCGGMQFLAEALGAAIEPLPRRGDQHAFEFGYFPVEITEIHTVLEGVGDAPVVRHAHQLHLPEAPSGFRVLGQTERTPVQIIVDDDRRAFGTQFHPEYWTEENPAGRTMIANFLEWADARR